ncbi:hypothetical protein [Afifella sp. H1R]|nr:hypothetical protein [Afifella sp. H1R]
MIDAAAVVFGSLCIRDLRRLGVAGRDADGFESGGEVDAMVSFS